MRSTLTNSFIISSILLLSACSSTSLGTKVPIEDRNNAKKPDETSTVGTQSVQRSTVTESRPIETITAPASQTGNDAIGIPSKRSIYFDYNSFSVKNEFQPLVEMHAKYLSPKKSQKIIIQGNTDERGGREYNLALGQKRAQAVKKSLSLLNVSETQMEAVSFGEEKPKAHGSDEASWAENRRVDIIYQ